MPWASGWVLHPSRGRFVALFVAVGLWNTEVLWGHPEDAIAVGLACYALVAVFDRRIVAAGWLLGAAIVVPTVGHSACSLGDRVGRIAFFVVVDMALRGAFCVTSHGPVDRPSTAPRSARSWSNPITRIWTTGRLGRALRPLSVAVAAFSSSRPARSGCCQWRAHALLALFFRRRLADPWCARLGVQLGASASVRDRVRDGRLLPVAGNGFRRRSTLDGEGW